MLSTSIDKLCKSHKALYFVDSWFDSLTRTIIGWQGPFVSMVNVMRASASACLETTSMMESMQATLALMWANMAEASHNRTSSFRWVHDHEATFFFFGRNHEATWRELRSCCWRWRYQCILDFQSQGCMWLEEAYSPYPATPLALSDVWLLRFEVVWHCTSIIWK